MSDRLILQPYKLPSEASKNINLNGGPYDPDSDEISEWIWASVVYHFKDQESVSEEELADVLNQYTTQQLLDDMVDRGLLAASWSEEQGEMVYSATDAGRKLYEEQ